jgi:tripeptidyl-peptidase I
MIADGELMVTGGTSASTPSFAGIVSLLNAIRINSGLSTLGYLQPRLYQAMAAYNKEVKHQKLLNKLFNVKDIVPMFYDITFGNSSQGGDHYVCPSGFVASEGWDAVTGWGSPRWEGLVKYLTNDA